MYIHRRKLRENENQLRTISLETSLGKVDQILGNETNSELWKAWNTWSLPSLLTIRSRIRCDPQ